MPAMILFAACWTVWAGVGLAVARRLYPKWRPSRVPLCGTPEGQSAAECWLALRARYKPRYNNDYAGVPWWPRRNVPRWWDGKDITQHPLTCYMREEGICTTRDLDIALVTVAVLWPVIAAGKLVIIPARGVTRVVIMAGRLVTSLAHGTTKITAKIITGLDKPTPAERDARIAELEADTDKMRTKAELDDLLDAIVLDANVAAAEAPRTSKCDYPHCQD